jgi:hypothetical protein
MRELMAAADFHFGTAPSAVARWRAAGRTEPAPAGDGRVIRYVLSDPSVGRDGHRIAADAWVLDNYLKNPVVLWAHDSAEPPIDRMVALGTVGDRLMGSIEYPEPGIYPFVDTVYELVRGGYRRIPIAWRYSQDRARPGGIDFTRVANCSRSARSRSRHCRPHWSRRAPPGSTPGRFTTGQSARSTAPRRSRCRVPSSRH